MKLSKLGTYTLEIYILQTIALETIMAYYIKMDYLNNTISKIITFSLISIVMILVCVKIANIVKKSPLHFVFGLK